MDNLHRKRTRTLFWVFVFVFLGLAGHLAYIQLYSGSTLSKQAMTQQTQTLSLEVPPRGQILDRHLRPLTGHRTAWRIVVFPVAVTDRVEESCTLAEALRVPQEEIARHLAGGAGLLPYDLGDDLAGQIQKLNLPGVIVTEAEIQSRKPPLASHLLGYLGRGDNNRWEGKMGIEAFYNRELQSAEPELTARVFLDARGQYISGLGVQLSQWKQDKDRKNVVLTIDRDIQQIAETVLDKSGIKDGAAVVMDAHSGDILAMASRPDYNVEAEVYNQSGNPAEQSFLNHGLSVYQPGSVFKVIVAAAALEEGLVKPETIFLCLGDKDDLVSCYYKPGHGLLTFAEAVAVSCNPTFARVGLKLGPEKLIEYAERFGMADGGVIGYKQNNMSKQLKMIAQPNNMVNASLGQWPVRATVVQITAMMAAVANDGVYMPPRLVSQIRNSDGKVLSTVGQGQAVRVVSDSTADVLQKVLEAVTTYGTGKMAYLPGGGSAGKTGSAQVGEETVDAWFSGYAPADNPRYVVTVLVNHGESGGKTAAPLFKEIVQEIMAKEVNN